MTTPPVAGKPDHVGPRCDNASGHHLPSVTVAVLTYRRPADLAALLPLLIEQAESVRHDCRILIIDNDVHGAGAAVAMGLGNALISAEVEPRPGIAAARNRALDVASTDLLVFIDDDERPSPRWLAELLSTHAHCRGAGVVGPVISRFAGTPDQWIAAGRFFDRRRLPTGTAVRVAATNNLLIDLGAVRRRMVRFDERFGISGGSDTLFTRQLVQRGGRLFWCDEAIVVDMVPVQRLTRRWVLRRAFRSGNGWSRTSILLASSPVSRGVTRLRLTFNAGVRVLGGVGRCVAGLLAGSVSQRARGARTIARGVGMLVGAYGFVFSEYVRPSELDDLLTPELTTEGHRP